MLENPGHLRNVVSPANFPFQCILESAQTLLLGGRHRQLMTLSVVGAKVQSEKLCTLGTLGMVIGTTDSKPGVGEGGGKHHGRGSSNLYDSDGLRYVFSTDYLGRKPEAQVPRDSYLT